MQQITLLERAREIIHNRKAKAAIAIVPIALAASARADTVRFVEGSSSLSNLFTGGFYGKVGQTLFSPIPTGVRLWGDTIQGEAPSGPDHGLNASDSLANLGKSIFDWSGELEGDVHAGDVFSVLHDFSIGLEGVGAGTVTWKLRAEVKTSIETLIYTLSNSDPSVGRFSGLAQQTFSSDASGVSWMANLDITWRPVNPTSELFVNIPDSGSIDLSVTAVPLPSAVWMGGAILGLLVWVRRKSDAKLA